MTYFLNSVSIEEVFKERMYAESVSQLNIYFKDLSYQQLRQEKAFDHATLFWSIGTLTAIILGGSLFSLVEIVDIIVKSLFNKYCMRDKTAT